MTRIALLTAGGLAPCLSSAVGHLIEAYTRTAPDAEIICYRDGYAGLLTGDSLTVTPAVRAAAAVFQEHGGSPIGNSRVKLTNVKDCVKRGLVREGEDPLAVAARRLEADGITILHTIGGDDTNTTAADLAAYLAGHGYTLTVVGLPKTIDNDVIPIAQSLGADTAAEQGARFFANVVNEVTANPRMLIVHEVMGRNCGWLTAATARAYREHLASEHWVPDLGLTAVARDIDAVYVPESVIDIAAETARLRAVIDAKGSAVIFVSEGACVEQIVAEMTAGGEEVERDAFGHVRLDKVNVGNWFSKQFAAAIGAEKALVQKSGYFSRAAAANAADRALIEEMVAVAVRDGLAGTPGVIGHDEERGNELRAIEFPRIKGGKAFDTGVAWFRDLLAAIGQPAGS